MGQIPKLNREQRAQQKESASPASLQGQATSWDVRERKKHPETP